MRAFLNFILKTIITLTALMILLDIIYTTVYYNGAPRDNYRWIRSMDGNDTLDYVLLGSSRTIYSLIPAQIDSITGTHGINLGYPSSGPIEIKLMLKEILKKKKVRTIFIQADYYWNNYTPDEAAMISWLPYIWDNDIYDEYVKYDKQMVLYKYIPFYRYMKFEGKIGFRNVFQSAAGRAVLQTRMQGYFPVDGTLQDTTSLHYVLNSQFNPQYREMIDICNKYRVQPVFFTSPLFHFTGKHTLFHEVLPNYHDFSNVISEPEFFKDKKHINHDGALIFTSIFANYYRETGILNGK